VTIVVFGGGDQVLAATPCDDADVMIGHFPFDSDIIPRVGAHPVENFKSARVRAPFCAAMDVA
jgi:hypothetical protein